MNIEEFFGYISGLLVIIFVITMTIIMMYRNEKDKSQDRNNNS